MKQKIRTYSELHWLDRGMDKLLIFGIILSLTMIAIEISSPPAPLASWMKLADVLLLGVFFTDSSRTFLKSRGIGQYLKHHWPDLLILLLFIVSLSSVLYVGLGRLSWLAKEEKVLQGFGLFR